MVDLYVDTTDTYNSLDAFGLISQQTPTQIGNEMLYIIERLRC